MRIRDAGDHLKSWAKPRNIYLRFSWISSAEGAGPYLANIPRPVLRGLCGEATDDSAASLPSQALRVRPCAAARALERHRLVVGGFNHGHGRGFPRLLLFST
jgi:hypothetical protein